jgi:hypothetical protein
MTTPRNYAPGYDQMPWAVDPDHDAPPTARQ